MKYVIIGNSTAAVGAIEGIRQIDGKGEIIVISSEPHHTYSRPLISYLLLGKTTEEKMKYRGDDFYTKNNVKFINAMATEIKGKEVVLSGGERIAFDKLLVATGSSPVVPPFEVKGAKEKFTFASLDDAKKLDKVLDKNKRVLIVGAGLIGLKCAEGILKRVAHITVVDLAPRILSSILDEGGAKLVQNHLEAQGIEFKLGTGFDKDADFDILVVAVGVRPNTDLLKDIAKIERGIVVNVKSETSAPDIYSAGDCTQSPQILPNAYMQGECAGVNMAGGEKVFDKSIPMNAIGFFGLHIITAGSYVGDVYSDDDVQSGNYKRLFYSDNKLNGYILIGNVDKAGIYTSLIREQTALDSIDFALVCEKPGLMAFKREVRKKKLG
ncbi:MAG: FAD-dependent oxidoreductase [Fibromonadales bacterium]|nr:FAD-dependent oxidoreductase [Fibromonadales bacterium]